MYLLRCSVQTIVKNRRITILKVLKARPYIEADDLLAAVLELGADTDAETLSFDILNLQQAGIQIVKEGSLYRLIDKIKLDIPAQGCSFVKRKVEGIERNIEHYVAVYADSLPPKLVDNLIRYGFDGTNSAALFEAAVERIFSLMGFNAQHLGQGYGRVADVIARYCGPVYAKSYGIIIDAKAYEKYTFPANDIRKMKEYICLHGQELMKDSIPNHAFAFVSMAFSEPDRHLEEIAHDTAVNGTAIDVFTLLELGSKVAKNELAISNLYPKFITNKLFSCA